MNPIIVGHRGAAAYELENTAASFRRAVDIGVDRIELDVHESLDGEFFVIHDAHTGRVSSRRERVVATSSSILKSIQLHGGQRLLTLNEALDIIPQSVGVMIEVKAMRSFEPMVRLLNSQMRIRDTTGTSFDLSLLEHLQQHGARCLGIVSKTETNLSRAVRMRIRFEEVCVDFQFLTKQKVSQFKARNWRVFAWTVDRESDIARVLDYGIDGIISNRPDKVIRILRRRVTGLGPQGLELS